RALHARQSWHRPVGFVRASVLARGTDCDWTHQAMAVARRHGRPFCGLVFTFAGTWLLLEHTALVRISFLDLWPLLLVFFGVYLVWQGVSGAPRRAGTNDSNATVTATAILGGVNRGNNSPAFKGGDLTAIMGGCEIDLRQAGIDGEAVIDVFALWGGIEIRVPEDWTVVSGVVPI